MSSKLNSSLQAAFRHFESEFAQIPSERKKILQQITSFIEKKLRVGEKAALNFICTHNSRRSHIAQLWAQAAAAYYGIENVQCYSGGTEATAFNPRAVKAMKEAGFRIVKMNDSENPRYEVFFSDSLPPLIAFSKVYSDSFNPSQGFAAVMTCSHADENCPLVVGAAMRISLPFNDPKDFDSTPQEAEKYSERVQEIGREISFAFSQIQK